MFEQQTWLPNVPTTIRIRQIVHILKKTKQAFILECSTIPSNGIRRIARTAQNEPIRTMLPRVT